jgi:general secretion pathway protein K
VLALIAGALIRSSAEEWKIARNMMAAAEAQALAEAGVFIIVHAIATHAGEPQIPIDGTPFEVEHRGFRIQMRVQDEVGRIDLNAAGDQLIRSALLSAGLSTRQADELADAIADWRDADDKRRLNGAERDDYLAAGLTVAPRNGPFEKVAELEQVLGMTRETFERLAPLFTVHAGRPFADGGVAPRDVLAVLLHDRPQELEAALQRRAEARPQAAAISDLAGRVFAIDAVATGSAGGNAQVTAIVRFTADPTRPVLFHEWKR